VKNNLPENNPHKRPSTGKKKLTPFEHGRAAASEFQIRPKCPYEDADAAASWARGYDVERHEIAKKALSWFLIGAGTPGVALSVPQQAGQLLASVMQTSGEALVCIFVGARMMNASQQLPQYHTVIDCYQAAVCGAAGRELPDHLKEKISDSQGSPTFNVIALAHRHAGDLKRFITSNEDLKAGKKTKVTIDAHGIMREIIKGPQ